MKKLIFVILMIFSISVSAMGREVTLSWDANTEDNLSYYTIYWGTASGNYSQNSGDIGLVTEYTVDIPDDGQSYYFAATAVNTAGLESDFSNEVSTVDDDGWIDDASTKPEAVTNLKKTRLVFNGPDGTKYTITYNGPVTQMVILYPDGTSVTINK